MWSCFAALVEVVTPLERFALVLARPLQSLEGPALVLEILRAATELGPRSGYRGSARVSRFLSVWFSVAGQDQEPPSDWLFRTLVPDPQLESKGPEAGDGLLALLQTQAEAVGAASPAFDWHGVFVLVQLLDLLEAACGPGQDKPVND